LSSDVFDLDCIAQIAKLLFSVVGLWHVRKCMMNVDTGSCSVKSIKMSYGTMPDSWVVDCQICIEVSDECQILMWLIYSSQTTQTTCPLISRAAINPRILPLLISLLIITTRPSFCSPTAIMSPALLMLNWRGKFPPAADTSTRVRCPFDGEMEYVSRLSERIDGPSGCEGLVILKDVSFLCETTRNSLSG